MNKVKVIIKEPSREPRIAEIETDLGSLLDIINGEHIYYVPFPTLEDDGIEIIQNDDAELLNFDKNIKMPNSSGFIAGTIIVCRFDKQSNAQSLTDEQISKATKYLKANCLERKQEAEAA